MTAAKISQLTAIEDPSLRAFADSIADGIIAAGLKAAAHHANPRQLALPRGDSLERAFLGRLRSLPLEQQQRIAAKSLPIVLGKQVKGLEGVDLTGANPVFALALSRAKKLAPPRAGGTLARRAQPSLEEGVPGFRQQTSPDRLQFHLLSVKCIDETDGLFGESGADEIALGGIMVDAAGTTTQIPRFNVGLFGADGAVKNFDPPKLFGSMDFRSGGDWPKSFSLVLTLVELDNGNFPEMLQKLYDEVSGKVQEEVTDAIGAGGSLGEAISAALDWALKKVFGWLKSWWEDDLFKPLTMIFDFDSADARWDGKSESGPQWLEFSGHGGRYKLWYQARLALASEAAQASGAIVYQHGNYGGTAVTLPVGHYRLEQLRARGMGNDMISSLKVGAGMRVIAYQHDNFIGAARMFTGAVPFVGNDFNDQISSIVVEPMRVMLFQAGNYGGASQSFGPGRYDKGQLTIGDNQASSLLVPPGYRVTLFQNAGFSGTKKVFTGDASYVGNDFNDVVSSLSVELL